MTDTQSKPYTYFNNGGRIEWLDGDEQTHVLCTVGKVNNQTPEDTKKATFIIEALKPRYEWLGEFAQLRKDKETLLGALEQILEHGSRPPFRSEILKNQSEALILNTQAKTAQAAIKEVTDD